MEWAIRFLIGGGVVLVFAMLGDVLKPKGFAGLFGAAPSVAVASLALGVHLHGADYAATLARSMIGGALAFFIYAIACTYAMANWRWRAGRASIGLLGLWGIAAVVLWTTLLRA